MPPAASRRMHAPVAVGQHANPFAALAEEDVEEDDEDDEDAGVNGDGDRGEDNDEAGRSKFRHHPHDGADVAEEELLNEAESSDGMEEWDDDGDGDDDEEEEEAADGPFEDEYDDNEDDGYDDDSQAGYTDGEDPATAAAAVPATPRLVDGKTGASADDAIEL